MKKILVVEDEPLMQKIIREVILQHFPEFQLLEGVSTVAEAWDSINSNSPDLVVLDIGLPDGTAFDLLRRVEIFDFKVVFLSAHEDYLVEAVRFSAASYVLKPFDLSELVFAIDKACDDMEEDDYQSRMEVLLSNANLPASARMVVFPTENSSRTVPLTSILYGEAVPGGCVIYVEEEDKIFVSRPLRHYEQMFGRYGFFRCHPLYVINLGKVAEVKEQSISIRIKGYNAELPIESRKLSALKQHILKVE